MAGSVLFRVDAGPEIGGGHAVRCLALAVALETRGCSCSFAVNPEAVASVPDLARHDLIVVPEDAAAEPGGEAAFLANALEGRPIANWLVVDHFGRGEDFEEACRGAVASRIAVIDGMLRRHACDLWIDPRPGQAGDHAALNARPVRVLHGPDYLLLRPEFPARREEALARRAAAEVETVVINFGAGAGHERHVASALRVLAEAGFESKAIVIAPLDPAERKAAAAFGGEIEWRDWVADMAEFYAEADLFIGAAGSASWERCALGLPGLAVVLAGNQAPIADELDGCGAAYVLKGGGELDGTASVAQLRKLLVDRPAYLAMSTAASSLCDGKGAGRVAEEMAR